MQKQAESLRSLITTILAHSLGTTAEAHIVNVGAQPEAQLSSTHQNNMAKQG